MIQGHFAEPDEHYSQVGAGHVVFGVIVSKPRFGQSLVGIRARVLKLTELPKHVAELVVERCERERADPRGLDSLGERNHLLLEHGEQVGVKAEPFLLGSSGVVLGLEAAEDLLAEMDHLADGILGDSLSGLFLALARVLVCACPFGVFARGQGAGQRFLGLGTRLFGVVLGKGGVLAGCEGIGEGSVLARASTPIEEGRRHRPGDDQQRHDSTQGGDPRIAQAPAPERFRPADGPRQNCFPGKEATEVLAERGSRVIALGGIFLQAFQANRFQVARDLGLELGWRDRLLGANLLERIQDRRGPERRAPVNIS